MSDITVVLAPGTLTHLAALHRDTLRARGLTVLVAGPEQSPWALLRAAGTPFAVLQRLPRAPRLPDHEALVKPLREGAWAAFALARAEGSRGGPLQNWTGLPLSSLGSGLCAVQTQALRQLTRVDESAPLEAQLAVDFQARGGRLEEVALEEEALDPVGVRERWSQWRTVLRRKLSGDEGGVEGFVTLERMQAAPRYNAWLGQRFRPHLGARVLEVGAGLGTITEQLAPGRERVIALEVESYFVDRLKARFADTPQVTPYLSGVELADWKALARERLDSVVLSNVLEHIQDDAEAVRNFRHVLQPGGKLLVLVPALPALFGSLDASVGHHRRYTPQTLRAVLGQNGFQVESVEWMNLLGIPGWFVNGRVFKRRRMPALQLRLFDTVMPLIARAEARVKLPVGMSLFAVARATA